MFIDVREPGTSWLLFRYDPERHLIEIQRRGVRTLIDLTQYQCVTVAGIRFVTDPAQAPDMLRFAAASA